MQPRPNLLVEPFCGGATVSLTAAFERLVERCLMVELDHDVAAFWHCVLRHGEDLRGLVEDFEPTRTNVYALASEAPRDLLAHGFRTLVLNRTRRGGILAAGASLSRVGENNKGVASRWYAQTLIRRLADIEDQSDRIAFCEGDGMAVLEAVADLPGTVAFVDPPYTAGGKSAGKRLYTHHVIDHRALFKTLAGSSVDFLMTYDKAPEIVELIGEFGFHAAEVMMKNTHHSRLPELVISRRRLFS
ncbi:MAG: DNA adenine methylase [bacterium]|nr:DNA adenine methylase [bacterium]